MSDRRRRRGWLVAAAVVAVAAAVAGIRFRPAQGPPDHGSAADDGPPARTDGSAETAGDATSAPPPPPDPRRPRADRLLVRLELPAGVSAEGAMVLCFRANRADGRPAADLGDGLFALDGADPEEDWIVAGRRPGCVPAIREGVRPGGEPIVLTLRASARVFGSVVDEDGLPYEGVGILLFLEKPREHREAPGPEEVPTRKTGTGADGAFNLDGLPSRSGWLVAGTRGGAREVRRIDVPEGTVELRIDLTLLSGPRFSGIVVGPGDEPLDGCWLALEQGNDHDTAGATGADGRFLVRTTRTGPLRLTAEPPRRSGLLTATEEGLSGKRDGLVLRAPRNPHPPAWVSASFLPLRGDPPESLDVTVVDAATGEAVARNFGSQFPGGRYASAELPPGRYVLRARCDAGYAESEPFAIEAGRETDLGILHLTPGGAVAGDVVDGGGAPVAGVRVEVGAMAEGDPALTDGEGRFRLRGLPPLETPLRFRHRDHDTVAVRCHVLADRTTVLPVTVLPAASGSVRGVVREGGAPPAKRMLVLLLPEGHRGAPDLRRRVLVAADGTFLAQGVPADAYTSTVAPLPLDEFGEPDENARKIIGRAGPRVVVAPGECTEVTLEFHR